MAMREKLIEILRVPIFPHELADPTEAVADYLLDNDVVPVVRCKDCENWMYEYDDVGLCVTDVPDVEGVQRYACDFCSYGERKDNGNV